MLVNLTSQSSSPQDYQIRVYQEDLDRDRVIYARNITLNAATQEKFWVYFRPQPTNGGLPDAKLGAKNTSVELEKALAVWLCTPAGDQLLRLPPTGLTLRSLASSTEAYSAQRGRKLILCVSDGASRPASADMASVLGVNEDIDFVQVLPRDLPENVLGYEAVDVILWLDANSADLTSAASRRLAALEQWIKQGGNLVVSQPADRFKIEEFSSLLPISAKDDAGNWLLEIRDRPDLAKLIELARYRQDRDAAFASAEAQSRFNRQAADWAALEKRGPFKVAHATAAPGAYVEEWITWQGEALPTPYIARRRLGLGSVSWVAQDLGSRVLVGSESSGWPYVWDRVLGFRNDSMRVKAEQNDLVKEAFKSDNTADLGGALLKEMEHEGRAGSYIALAVLFFLGYWLLAGPASYLILSRRGKKQHSWSIFAAVALAATLLTVAVVRIVLRGRPQAHHITLVRLAPDLGVPGGGTWQAEIDSRIGLYIPASSRQHVAISGQDPAAVSYLTPFPINPAYLNDDETGFSDKATYTVAVRDDSAAPIAIDVPYRSTLKKLEAKWVGNWGKGGIEGNASLYPPNTVIAELGRNIRHGYLDGVLFNRTGADFRHVYFAFNGPWLGRYDYVLYVPEWPDGKPIDLRALCNDASGGLAGPGSELAPGQGKVILGYLTFGERGYGFWDKYWLSGLGRRSTDVLFDDSRQTVRRSFPMLSLFDRMTPQPIRSGSGEDSRSELLRRGARRWDMSNVVAAGGLVVLAQAAGEPGTVPLPFPLEVEGDRVSGAGTVFYQFALPLDHSKVPTLPESTTQPAQSDAAGGASR